MSGLKVFIIVGFVLSNLSCNRDSPKIPPNFIIGRQCENPLIFKLSVNKQTREREFGYIKASIDGTLVINENFGIFSPHFYKKFSFNLCPGNHNLSAEIDNDKGAEEMPFILNSEVDEAILSYGYDENNRSQRSVDFIITFLN